MAAAGCAGTLSSHRQTTLIRTLKLLAIPVLAILLWNWAQRSGFNWTQFRQTFAEADPWKLALAALMTAFTYVIRAARWRVMIRSQKPDAPLWPMFRDTLIGFAAAVILGRAGEFVRPCLIARSLRLPFSSQVAVWFLERLMDLIAVLIFFGAALLQLDPAAAKAGPEIRSFIDSGGRLLGIAGTGSLIALLVFRSFSPASAARWGSKLTRLPARIRTKVQGFLDSFALGMEATRDFRALFGVLSYTVVEWLVIAACFWACLTAFPATRNFTVWDSLVVMGFASFGSIVQIPGVGGGMQILIVVVLSQLYGVAVEPATAIATMLWAITFALVAPPGIVLALQSGLGWRELRTPGVEDKVTSESS